MKRLMNRRDFLRGASEGEVSASSEAGQDTSGASSLKVLAAGAPDFPATLT